jgi:hypothetical protein
MNSSWEQHIEKLITALLARSGRDKDGEKDEKITSRIRQLVLRQGPGEQPVFDGAPLQIAAFMGGEDHE